MNFGTLTSLLQGARLLFYNVIGFFILQQFFFYFSFFSSRFSHVKELFEGRGKNALRVSRLKNQIFGECVKLEFVDFIFFARSGRILQDVARYRTE